MQGFLEGLAFAIGYGLWIMLMEALRLLELTPRRDGSYRRLRAVLLVVGMAVIVVGLSQATRWQHGVRAAMQLPPVEIYRPLVIVAVAGLVALILILAARFFRRAWMIVANLMLVVLPMRAALLCGLIATSALFWSIGSGVLVRGLIDGLDAAYAEIDALIPAGIAPPDDPLRSGGPASPVSWASLGAAGQAYMLAAPDRAAIEEMTGRTGLQPIRVYIGVNSASDPAARAELALAEMKRTGDIACFGYPT